MSADVIEKLSHNKFELKQCGDNKYEVQIVDCHTNPPVILELLGTTYRMYRKTIPFDENYIFEKFNINDFAYNYWKLSSINVKRVIQDHNHRQLDVSIRTYLRDFDRSTLIYNVDMQRYHIAYNKILHDIEEYIDAILMNDNWVEQTYVSNIMKSFILKLRYRNSNLFKYMYTDLLICLERMPYKKRVCVIEHFIKIQKKNGVIYV